MEIPPAMLDRLLTSRRLSLRPIEPAEATTLHELWIDERVRRFLWDGKVIPFEQTQDTVEKSVRLFEERGFGLWGMHEHGSAELIGFVGYWYFRTPPALELVYGVHHLHWNLGLATEASRSVIAYGFDQLGFETIDASTDVGNSASVKVLEKLGMSFRRRNVVEGLDTLFHSLQRNEWWKANKPLASRNDGQS
jgi:RimJ/RimL family protein N-acetyltransferase